MDFKGNNPEKIGFLETFLADSLIGLKGLEEIKNRI